MELLLKSLMRSAEVVLLKRLAFIIAVSTFPMSSTTLTRPYPTGDIKNAFNRACRKAGIRDFHFHDLRHTAASHLVMAGQDITTVKELLGHKTLTMTLRYAHLAPSHKVKALDALDSIINGSADYTKTRQFGKE